MMRYSVQPRDQILVKGDWSLYLMKMWEKNIGKDISKNLTSKYSQKLLDHPKRLATDAIKTALKRQLKKKKHKKTSRSNWWFDDDEIANKITKTSKYSPQNTSESVKSEVEIPKERYTKWAIETHPKVI